MKIENIDIKWLGHDTFRIVSSDGKVIYTDPFKIKTMDKADIILITHAHYDHCSAEDVGKISSENTTIIAPKDCALTGNVKVIKPYDKLNISGIKIETVPAYNTNKRFHPKESGWVGYVFEVDGKRIYLAGDTDYIPEMDDLKNIDIALVPVSGTYVMTAEEAAQAVNSFKPKVAIPMHYGSIISSRSDAEKFKKLAQVKVEILG